MASAERRIPIESGCPDGIQYMHPVMRKNFGHWRYHEDSRPGVLRHVAESGDEIWTVRAGTQRILDLFTLRKLCEIGDQFADGYVRFTIRSNIEFMLSDGGRVASLIEALESNGFVVGGTRNSVAAISHTQGWLHCDIPATDASGVVKSMMDQLVDEFRQWNMPNRVHITTSCCQINCGGQGDIAINIQHTKPPKIDHTQVANVCERPSVVARCPVAAIRPAMVNGKPSLEVDERKCVCCGACYPPCPPMQINDPEHSKLAVWVGGNHSNARGRPTFQKLVAAGIPNNPPRWPEATAIVKRILQTYQTHAKDWERINDWVERIGWPRFFELTGLPFTKFHIDNWRGQQKSLNASTHLRF
ncbi:MAG: dissimilatory-type sulfite reductase subunit beta [Candidatus Thiodiazotropha taylori]|nr:dissimilatory-type sulfite reductase subunit beta [Candidatus Thiodiazotropha taylori]MCG7994459.1 dissimilatory-type sulfite reductase subunit beta [Candidatus Thiodiazotropha taylori]MCG8055902.1 dissimilatory-type sulfite reductase subunit beta [Candidatus Thiodiazotropha taylori]MCG8067319.1 dissimilatory-type sulfite reductase subunit beta [Candidatus Thiodiazotropha taylori]MCG8080340.1 dissimilatory-type sulfite reductase subunit beta [Candidatus Thiodiazotropha taylori]